jgi:hypothetical protein
MKSGDIYIEEYEDGERISRSESNLFPYLNERVELEEGYTLRDYFNMLMVHKEFWSFDNFIPSFIEEYKNCTEYFKPELEYLELCKIASYEYVEGTGEIILPGLFDDPFNGYKGLDIYCNFDGYKNEEKYAIEFTPLKKILDCPLKIGENRIYIYEDKKTKEYSADDSNISLYEFIKEIILELSFCGTPENRDKKWVEMTNIVKDIEKEIKE